MVSPCSFSFSFSRSVSFSPRKVSTWFVTAVCQTFDLVIELWPQSLTLTYDPDLDLKHVTKIKKMQLNRLVCANHWLLTLTFDLSHREGPLTFVCKSSCQDWQGWDILDYIWWLPLMNFWLPFLHWHDMWFLKTLIWLTLPNFHSGKFKHSPAAHGGRPLPMGWV